MELENLAKMYLADLIKKECWDNMVVKGRGIGVSNFSNFWIIVKFCVTQSDGEQDIVFANNSHFIAAIDLSNNKGQN